MAASPGRGRIEWIDAAKGMGILLVIFGHSLTTGSLARQLIFSFHMPLFFFLAGCTFRPRGLKETARRSAKSLLIPYCLLFFAWQTTRALAGASGNIDVGALAGSFVFASGTTVKPFGLPTAGMLWFLAALFLCRVLFEAQFALTKRRAHPTRALVVSAVALSAAGYLWATLTGIYLPGSLELALFCQQYMLAGYLFFNQATKAPEGTPRMCTLLVAAVVLCAVWVPCALNSSLSLAGRRFDGIALLELASFAGIGLCVIASMLLCRSASHGPVAPVRRFVLFAGSNSMALFCIHALDWGISWAPLANLASLPHAYALSGVIRVAAACAVLCAIRAGMPKVAPAKGK